MATARAERRLAAILAADVVGYSRLVEHDEAGTLSALKVLRREVIDPLLAEHQGRIVKLMGDGALVEFGSVVDAVACAVAIQKGVAENQADIPTERRIIFRIGVNLGDVVHEDDGDLYGDGVNIAARLQTLAIQAAFAFPARRTITSRAGLTATTSTSANARSRTWSGRCDCTAWEWMGCPAHNAPADAQAWWPPWLSRSRLRRDRCGSVLPPGGNLSALCLLVMSLRGTSNSVRDPRSQYFHSKARTPIQSAIISPMA
jgi:class 3 adenylate cyclase